MLAGHLIEELKEANEPRETVERILRHWAGLREVIMSDREDSLDTLLEPSIERFRDLLSDIERTHPDLEPLFAALEAGLGTGLKSNE